MPLLFGTKSAPKRYVQVVDSKDVVAEGAHGALFSIEFTREEENKYGYYIVRPIYFILTFVP